MLAPLLLRVRLARGDERASARLEASFEIRDVRIVRSVQVQIVRQGILPSIYLVKGSGRIGSPE